MAILLSFEEWKLRYINLSVSDELKKELREIHDIDAADEIDRALEEEYQLYLERNYSTNKGTQ